MRIEADHRFGEGCLHDHFTALGNMNGQQSASASQAGAGSQQGGTHFTFASGDKQSVTESPFMRKLVAGLEYFRHIFFRHHHIRGRSLVDDILMNTDIQHFPFAYIFGIFGEEEGQFRETERQCQACPYDSIRVVGLIILAKQSGGNVYRYDCSFRLVDIFYHGSESAGQRTVQTGTEQAVDHDIAVGQYRRNEIGNHFSELHFLQSEYPLLVHFAIKRKMLGRVEQIRFYFVAFILPCPAKTMMRVCFE